MVADTMATLDAPHLPIITPGNATIYSAKEISRVCLTRKLYVLGERCAVAFAGQGDRIRSLLDELEGSQPRWSRAPEPIAALGEIAARYADVEMVAEILEPGGPAFCTNGVQEDKKYLGPCGFIGSGAESLREQAREYEREREKIPYSNPYLIAKEFSLQLNSRCLAGEALGAQQNWGGYFESVMHNSNGTWSYGERCLHMLFRVESLSESSITLHVIPRMLAYDPGGASGRIFMAAQSPDGHVLRDYNIESLIHPIRFQDIVSTEEFWGNWLPDIVSLAAVIPSRNRGVSLVTQHIERKCLAEDGLSFWIRGRQCDARLSNEEFHLFGRGAARRMGMEYVEAVALPSKEIRPF